MLSIDEIDEFFRELAPEPPAPATDPLSTTLGGDGDDAACWEACLDFGLCSDPLLVVGDRVASVSPFRLDNVEYGTLGHAVCGVALEHSRETNEENGIRLSA